jgi:hypothetical protein
MRWLVEVSRVSDGSSSERYCIDARRWQSALQEVRRLRGDEGPLPKLTIELLDSGYRAIDPELKVRYVVTEAPPDMAATAGAQVRHSTQPPPAEDAKADIMSSLKPSAAAAAAAAAPKASPSLTPAATPSVPAGSAAAPDGATPLLLPAQVIRQRDESPTAESPIHFRELALAVKPGAPKDGVEALLRARLEQARTNLNVGDAQQYIQIAVFDHMFVKRPVRAPIATLAWKNWRGEAVLAFPGFGQKAADSSPSSAAPSSRPPSWNPPKESQAPTSVAPAPVVSVGSSGAPPAPAATAAPAAPAAFPAPAAPAAPAPPTAFAAPAATAAAAAPAATGAPAAVPRPGAASASSPPTARTSVIPAPVVAVGVRTPPPQPGPDVEIPVPLVARVPPEGRVEAPGEDELEIAVEVGPASAPVLEIALESIPVSDIPVSSAPPPELPSEAPPPRPKSIPPPKPSTQPPPSSGPRRRAAGEDLIGELFERMHELAFAADLVSGAEYVLHVLSELIPCEGIVVHVFDLSKRSFVVVRAHGPNVRDTLLHRTADDEPLVREVMSRRSALVLDGAPNEVPAASRSLSKLGVQPRAVLCGAARLGGRYLGLIELANPAGGKPFHEGEANALDYVCEQFAEFVASRPIVLDADVVVGQ